MRRLHEIRRRLKRRQKPDEPWPARVGDASGTIEVPGNPGLWYVRPEGSDLPVIVHRGAAPKIRDYPVWVGSDVYKKRVKRILGVNATSFSAGTGAGGSSPSPLEPHAPSHYETGWDVVYVTTAQVVDALVYVSGGMNVTINPGWAIIGGKATRISMTVLDMTSHVPASGARWALIRVDSTGAVSVQDGSMVGSLADLTAADMPRLAIGYAALAAVRLYAGQTALSNMTEARDVVDLRLAQNDGAGGGLSYAIGLYDSSSLRSSYEASYAGLTTALGDALSGDTIILPPGSYSGDISIPDGVALVGQTRDTTRIVGRVTTLGTAVLQNLMIERITPDAQNEKALVISGENKMVTLIGLSIIASVPQSGTCYGISIEGLQAQVQARDCYLSGTWNQSTLVYFTGLAGQEMNARYVYFDGNNPTNDASKLFTYACQFDPQAASYGTPQVGDRAAYDHTHDAAYLKRSAGDFATFAPKSTLVDADQMLIEDSAAAGGKKYATLAVMRSSLQVGFDADKLDGQDGSYYQNASNINAGTLSTDRFSAYSDLSAENKLGMITGRIPSADNVRFSPYVASYGVQEDFTTTTPSGFSWAGSPFSTPPVQSILSNTWLRQSGFTSGERSFLYKSATHATLLAYISLDTNYEGMYTGLRMDDGTDDNYVEFVIWWTNTGNRIRFYSRRRVGGGTPSETEYTHLAMPILPQYTVMLLRRNATDWSSWPAESILYAGTATRGGNTSTNTWTPTRVGWVTKFGTGSWQSPLIDFWYSA